MVTKNYHFNNGPEGGTLSANNNSNNGDVFNTVTTYAPARLTLKAVSAFHGAYGCRYFNSTNDYGTVGQWTISPGTGNYAWVRSYNKIDRTNPNGSVNVISWEPVNFGVQFGSTGKFRIEKLGGAVVSSSMSYTANTWYRIESMIYVHASAGQCTARIYAGDSTVLLEEFKSAANVNTTSCTTMSIAGAGIYSTPAAFTVDSDSVGYSTDGWMGPLAQNLVWGVAV